MSTKVSKFYLSCLTWHEKLLENVVFISWFGAFCFFERYTHEDKNKKREEDEDDNNASSDDEEEEEEEEDGRHALLGTRKRAMEIGLSAWGEE